MQLIITDAWLAKSRAIHLRGWQVVAAMLAAALVLMLTAVGLYHWVFLKGAREGWPIVSDVVRLVARDEFAQQDRRLRDNLDAMARRLGEMQARMVQLESLGERVSGLAGLPPAEVKTPPGRGGVLIEGDRSRWTNCTARWMSWTAWPISGWTCSPCSSRGCSSSACAA